MISGRSKEKKVGEM